ncbi:heavy metal translocating P-type ATPase [Pleionea sp. CnH1-48]|uniref:heavy metal translocating P-type ATPase n=1 Tax=Pleionea sp. CnH1-48 TaxID=2954494 RepID=UPI002098619B|nr:heavy metal translocating P-type ATPase [Pleionea sp. CnH1-48]MCO7223940.1 heavy metal translocating P-type ATPase [Pleionea sp. CnH1-48]
MTSRCFHCHEPVPDNLDITLQWEQQTREFCCYGCHSVASAIIDNQLDSYYRFRTEASVTPTDLIPEELRNIQQLDNERLQKEFVDTHEHQSKALLGVEGITCAACSWLIESSLLKMPGVLSVQVNPITHRMNICWDSQRQRLSQILTRLSNMGFKAYPFRQSDFERTVRTEDRWFLMRLGVAGLGMMQVMMFAIGLYFGEAQYIKAEYQSFLHWTSWLVATPIVFFSGFPFFKNAWYGLKQKRLVMDFPVALAISLAYTSSVWATINAAGQVYFDSATMFIFFLLCGRYLEHRTRLKAVTETQTQRQLLPIAVTKIEGAQQSDHPIHDVVPGDRLLVRAGEVIPVDGIIVDGTTNIDESLLSGEHIPLRRSINDKVFAGSLNQSKPIHIEVTATSDNTYFSALDRMASNATQHKPKLTLLVDRIAQWFVSILLMLVGMTYFLWSTIDPEQAFWVALSVLVVSCPCALSLATPAALTAATNRLSQLGLLLLNAQTLNRLADITHIVFDKTGTLTEGKLHLEKTIIHQPDAQLDYLQIACALERQSRHPIAKAFQEKDDKQVHFESVDEQFGMGIEGQWNGSHWYLGKPKQEISLDTDSQTMPIFLYRDQVLVATFELSDKIREQAADLVKELHQLGLKTSLLSGDHSSHVKKVADELGIQHYYNNHLPQQKAEKVMQWQQQNEIVLMLGDGLNDTIVLAQANVGIAMNTSADLTQHKADAVLMHQNLYSLAQSMELAKKTHAVIKQNIVWAISYNLCAIPIAMLGWVPPWLAAIGMTTSSLIVVLNALRLNRSNNETSQ